MFSIKEAGSKGQGWFATRDIPAMIEILNKTCLFRVPRDADSAAVNAKVSALPPDTLEVFSSLHGKDNVDKFWSNCNSYPNGDVDNPFELEPRKELGLYLQSAKLNHSCRPNATPVMEDSIMRVIAQKNIKKGEEITISYVDNNFQTAKNRLKENRRCRYRTQDPNLDLDWVQGCMCELCTGSEEELQASDKRRRKLADLRRILVEGGYDLKMAVNKMLTLMDKEGLSHGDMGMHASMAFITMIAKKDKTVFDSETMHTIYARNLAVGEKVKVQNLVQRPLLHGHTATVVVAYNAQTGRVGVKMDDDDDLSPMAIHVKNLFLSD
jgi:hypothetical protein